MAWHSSGLTNRDLIHNLAKHHLLTSPRLIEAMHRVDRAHYLPSSTPTSLAYQDAPQPLGYNATISAPHMHAHAFENLAPFLVPGSRVLDVGSGSGYCAAVFHHLVSPASSLDGGDASGEGKVVGIEHIAELVEMSRGNLKRDGLQNALETGKVELVAGDGRKGWSLRAPYDAIHVGAAAPFLPDELVEQLKRPGRMFIPVDREGGYGQDIWQVDKDKDGSVTKQTLFQVNYVPLTDEAKQRR